MKGLYNIAVVLVAVWALMLPKAHANSFSTFTHLAPAKRRESMGFELGWATRMHRSNVLKMVL